MSDNDHKMMRRIGVFAFIALVILAVLMPWKVLIESRLEYYLETQGFENVQLTISGIGPEGIRLKDISIGKIKPLHLDQLTLGFSFRSLINGAMRDLTLSGLNIESVKEGKAWNISGLQPAATTPATNPPLKIPVTDMELAKVPFETINLENSNLHLFSDGMQADIPINIVLHRSPSAEITYDSKKIDFKAYDIEIITGDSKLHAVLDPAQQQWAGAWQVNDIKISGTGSDIPALNGEGTISARTDEIVVKGQFMGEGFRSPSRFSFDYFLNEPRKSKLSIIELSLPWKGGFISLANVTVPLVDRQNLDIPFKVEHVALSALMQQITGKKVTATGGISGIIPLTLHADQTFSVHAGNLAAEQPGIISIPDNILPGDNAQITFARNVLKNFHYTVLSIHVDQDQNKRLSVLMKLSGNNPDVSEGRPVNLSVQLTGDVLEFILKNLIMLSNPEKLLQQGPHEIR